MSENTDHIDKGTYVIVKGAISMFGVSDLKVVGGGSSIEHALSLFDKTEPHGNIKDINGSDVREHTYMMIIIRSKVEDD
jgi:uncharacterized membrane protein